MRFTVQFKVGRSSGFDIVFYVLFGVIFFFFESSFSFFQIFHALNFLDFWLNKKNIKIFYFWLFLILFFNVFLVRKKNHIFKYEKIIFFIIN